jgi:hypothetical protein
MDIMTVGPLVDGIAIFEDTAEEAERVIRLLQAAQAAGASHEELVSLAKSRTSPTRRGMEMNELHAMDEQARRYIKAGGDLPGVGGYPHEVPPDVLSAWLALGLDGGDDVIARALRLAEECAAPYFHIWDEITCIIDYAVDGGSVSACHVRRVITLLDAMGTTKIEDQFDEAAADAADYEDFQEDYWRFHNGQ